MSTGGGGGYGDPTERSAEDVRQDVLDRHVSPAAALARYGIADL
jgi:N-methylhydantoinase B